MTSGKQVQTFHTDDVSVGSYGYCPIGCVERKICFNHRERLPRSIILVVNLISMEFLHNNVLSFLKEISDGVMKIMSATFSGYSNRNAAEKGQLNLHCTSLGLQMHCNAGQQSSPTAQFRVTIIIIMLLAWM